MQPWEDDQVVKMQDAPPPAIAQPWEDSLGSSTVSSSSSKSSLEPQDLLSKIYHPAIIGAGMTIGGGAAGTMALPAGPIASGIAGVAGGTAMYGPSNDFANSIDAMRGMQSPSPSRGVMSDLGTGAEVEAGGRVLGAAIKGAAPAMKSAIVKSISSVFGPSEDAINAWIENPRLPNSDDIVTLARKVPQTLNKLKGLISQADYQAGTLLSNSSELANGAMPKSQLLQLINKEQSAFEASPGNVVPGAPQAASDHLSALANTINQVPGDTIPQTGVKKLIQTMDGNINFANKDATPLNNALTNIRTGASKFLKTNSKPYENAMKEVSSMLGVHDNVINDLGLTQQTGQGLQPSNQTISALQNINKATKSITQDHLNDLAKLTGDDYVADAQNAKYAQEFKTGYAQGSRRTILGTEMGGTAGAAVGGMVGHPVIGAQAGGMLGGFAGAAADKFGGPMAGVATNLIRALAPHMPIDLATRIVSSVFAPQSTPQGQIGSGQ